PLQEQAADYSGIEVEFEAEAPLPVDATDHSSIEMEFAAEAPLSVPVADPTGIEVEFGADELGAAAEREGVRVQAADSIATGVHKALDVAAMAPELPPDQPADAP